MKIGTNETCTYTVKAIYTWDNWMEDAAEGEFETSATGAALFIEAEELVREWGYKPMRPGPDGDGGCYHLYSEKREEIDWENLCPVTTVESVIVITVWPDDEEEEGDQNER